MERHVVKSCMFMCLLLLVVSGAGAFGDTPAVAPEPDAVQQPPRDAAAILHRMSDYYRSLDTVAFKTSMKMTVEEKGETTEQKARHSVAIGRPNRLSMIPDDDAGQAVTCDGDKIYIYSAARNAYSVQEAPDDLDGVLQATRPGPATVGIWLATHLLTDPYADLEKSVFRGEWKHLGREETGGNDGHHVRAVHEQRRGGGGISTKFQLDIWVAVGKEPFLEKFMLTTTNSGSDLEDRTEVVVAHSYTNWSADSKLAEEKLAFTPPEGATKIDAPRRRPKRPSHPLVGQPAPDFELPLLAGGTMSLSAHKGKDVVVLDFWASWCGPCRRGLPVVARVTGGLKDKGVAFYAVNLRETPEVAKEWIEKMNIDCNVALDGTNQVGNLYQVEGIPQTVIIGTDGVISNVHVGFAPNMEKALQKELEELAPGT